jgi:CHAD domain-containing protein
MLDFLPPDEMTLAEAGESLTTRLPVNERRADETDRTFYDTFDGLLHEEGISCVHEDGRLVLFERGDGRELAAASMPLPAKPLTASELADGALREQLARVIGVRALLPLAHVHSRSRSLGLLDGEQKTVVRMTLEEPMLVSGSSVHTALRPRVRVAAVRGYEDELRDLTARLEGELGFRAADQPLVDEAVRATGRAPGGVPSKPDVALSANERTDVAAARVLRRLLEVMAANLDGTLADIDSEFLHDFRVAVRRSRSVQRELKRAFPPDELAQYRGEFRWLQQATGDARDLDVYVLEFADYRAMLPEAMRADLDPLLTVLRERRLMARREMTRALRSDRTAKLIAGWAEFLDRLPELPFDDRPDAARPIAEVSAERIQKVYRRMLKMGRAIGRQSPAEDYHELRKKGKELRYLLELFGAPLYPNEVVKPMIKSLKGLQDVLGRHQDREVQTATIRALRDAVSLLPDGAAALMAMGVLIERLGDDERRARSEFAQRFGAFASKAHRAAIEETFA